MLGVYETIDLTGDDDTLPSPSMTTSSTGTGILSPHMNGQGLGPQRLGHGHISIPMLNPLAHHTLPSTSSAFSLGMNHDHSNGLGNGSSAGNDIIDLTRTPSPQHFAAQQYIQQQQLQQHRPQIYHRQISIPPAPQNSHFSQPSTSNGAMTMPHPPPSFSPQIQAQNMMNHNPQKPVCIGQVSCTALVLYPIPYLVSSAYTEGLAKDGFAQFQANDPNFGQISQKETNIRADWVMVRLKVEPKPTHDPNNMHFSLPILTPSLRGPNGETQPPEQFGVVEQKVASVLGSMLAKGLIKLESRILRGKPSVSHSSLPLKQKNLDTSYPRYIPHLFT